MLLPQQHIATKWKAIVVTLVVVVAALVFFFFFTGENSFTSSTGTKFDSIQGCKDLDRSDYDVSPQIFSALPSPPKCFDSITAAYRTGKFDDDFFFTREYYLQPEFFPSFLQNGIEVWKNPVTTHYGAVGYGAFPFEKAISLSPGKPLHVRMFLFSGFGIRSVQGARILYRTDGSPESEKITISIDADSANGFLLGPTFPQFNPHWVKPVDITLTADAALSSPSVITFIVAAPLNEVKAESLAQAFPYFSATDYVGEKQAFRLIINPPQ